MNQDDLNLMQEIFQLQQQIMQEKSKKYGDQWKPKDFIDQKVLNFADIHSCYCRLKTLIWDNHCEDMYAVQDKLLDMANFCVLTMMAIKIEQGVFELQKTGVQKRVVAHVSEEMRVQDD